jgi:hypothetical protein
MPSERSRGADESLRHPHEGDPEIDHDPLACGYTAATVILMKTTVTSLELFLAYARDAGNWGGTPCVGANVSGSKELRGNLTQLKRAGLVTTFMQDGERWIRFTDVGKSLARTHGIEV